MASFFTAWPVWPDLPGEEFGGDPGYWQFYEALLNGRLRLGQTITQEALCEVLGLSLSPLRETMTILAAEGLIEVRKRVGVRIVYPDVAFVRTHFQFRALIEREGLRKLSGSVTPDWLDRMEADHVAMIAEVGAAATSADYERPMRHLEQRLHGGFVAAFENPYITDVHSRLLRKLYLLRLLHPAGVNQRSTIHALEEHLEILNHLRVRDGESAAEALDRHLSGVFHRTLGI
jgi:DNA-binding GntR family transcriptional regulator